MWWDVAWGQGAGECGNKGLPEGWPLSWDLNIKTVSHVKIGSWLSRLEEQEDLGAGAGAGRTGRKPCLGLSKKASEASLSLTSEENKDRELQVYVRAL